jgi:hypothetical protein
MAAAITDIEQKGHEQKHEQSMKRTKGSREQKGHIELPRI